MLTPSKTFHKPSLFETDLSMRHYFGTLMPFRVVGVQSITFSALFGAFLLCYRHLRLIYILLLSESCGIRKTNCEYKNANSSLVIDACCQQSIPTAKSHWLNFIRQKHRLQQPICLTIKSCRSLSSMSFPCYVC